MTEELKNKCELFERNRSAIAGKFMLEKSLMSTAAGLILTGADKEADVGKLKECRKILNRHTGFFSEYRDAVKLALVSGMALSDDAEQYIEDVKAVYKKLHKGHFKDNSYMVLAAMLICDLGRQGDADLIVEKHNELMKRMDKLHPLITDSEDISYVILLALSDRPADAILSDMEECLEHLKKVCKVKAGSDTVQRLSEILALTDGDIREKCERVIRLSDALEQSKTVSVDGYAFSSLGMLIGINEEPEVIAGEILGAYEFLKEKKIFGNDQDDKKQRLMFAELLAAQSLGTGTEVVSNAFINNAISVIKAKQTAAMISIISNVLPVVLGAVSGSDSSGAQSGNSSHPEQSSSGSGIEQD